MASGPTSVDVQDLAGDEHGSLEIQDPVDDVLDLAHPAERVKLGEARVGRTIVHRSLDDSGGDGIHPHAA